MITTEYRGRTYTIRPEIRPDHADAGDILLGSIVLATWFPQGNHPRTIEAALEAAHQRANTLHLHDNGRPPKDHPPESTST